MITIPIYDTILLPDVNFFFKKEVIEKWDLEGHPEERPKAGMSNWWGRLDETETTARAERGPATMEA